MVSPSGMRSRSVLWFSFAQKSIASFLFVRGKKEGKERRVGEVFKGESYPLLYLSSVLRHKTYACPWPSQAPKTESQEKLGLFIDA